MNESYFESIFAIFDEKSPFLSTGCLKKTEFCQIEHLQILLVIGEKYLMIFVANPVVSCFESAISMLLLGAWRMQPWGHTGSGKGH